MSVILVMIRALSPSKLSYMAWLLSIQFSFLSFPHTLQEYVALSHHLLDGLFWFAFYGAWISKDTRHTEIKGFCHFNHYFCE